MLYVFVCVLESKGLVIPSEEAYGLIYKNLWAYHFQTWNAKFWGSERWNRRMCRKNRRNKEKKKIKHIVITSVSSPCLHCSETQHFTKLISFRWL